MENLDYKIETAILLLKKAERLALLMQPDKGFYLAFSGGKDSQVVLRLAQMAGVKYHAVYNVTTNDPADNVRFIKTVFPDVEFDVPVQSYFRMIEKKGLPTIGRRWCCDYFKEVKGTGSVVLTGARAAESLKRSQYTTLMRHSKRKEVRGSRDIDFMIENSFRCVHGRDKFLLHPILKWSNDDVWRFHEMFGLPYNTLYDTNQRVGCVFCPFATGKRLEEYERQHPKQTSALLHALEKYIQNKGIDTVGYTAKDYYESWKKKISVKKYMELKKQASIRLE